MYFYYTYYRGFSQAVFENFTNFFCLRFVLLPVIAIRLFLNSFLFSPSFLVIYSKRQAGFPLRLNPAKNLFYDFFFTCFKNQPLFATFSYFLPLSFSLLQTAPSPFSVTFLMRHPLTYKRTLFSRQYTVSEKISPNFYKFFCRVFFCAHRHSHFSAHKHYLL